MPGSSAVPQRVAASWRRRLSSSSRCARQLGVAPHRRPNRRASLQSCQRRHRATLTNGSTGRCSWMVSRRIVCSVSVRLDTNLKAMPWVGSGSDAAGHGRYSSPFAEIKLRPVPLAEVRGLFLPHAARERDRCRTGLRSSQRYAPARAGPDRHHRHPPRPKPGRKDAAPRVQSFSGSDRNDFPIVLPYSYRVSLQSYQSTI
jgi:hypothetical protein